MYVMFIGVSASGLMATAQLGPIAKDYGISNTVIFMGASTLSVALVVDNVLNGLARPFFGGLSDRIGRERTMALAFTLGAISYWLLAVAGHSPWAFVVCAGLIFFTWGEIFSLFPSTCTDTFGPEIRHRQCQPALHREGHVGIPRAAGECAEIGDWNLGVGVPGCGGYQCGGRAAGAVRAAADAGQPDAARQDHGDAPGLSGGNAADADAAAS